MPAASPSGPLPDSSPRRATSRFMLSHPAHLVALGFGSGLPRRAPGTFGTLWAWVAYLAMQHWLSAATIGWIIGVSLPLGWWACTVTARHMHVADPGAVVWDEVVAFWIVLWIVMPTGLFGQIAAFALFRFFDAVKIGPVGWADRLFKQKDATPETMRWRAAGFGILFDDLVAAFCTLLVIAALRAW